MNKVIHYCWFGGKELPELAKKCISSWEKYCPDYEIKRWDENNFDCNLCDYISEAYNKKRWAFVSDYARFWILFHYGGLYFDTDVELIKPIDDIIETGSFMGLEKRVDFKSFKNIESASKKPLKDLYIAPGLGMYSKPGLEIYEKVLKCYENRHFLKPNGSEDTTTIVEIVSDVFRDYPIEVIDDIRLKISDVYIYRKDVFCPMDYRMGEMQITDNTRAIHHYSASWMNQDELLNQKLFKEAKQKYGDTVGKIVGGIETLPIRIKAFFKI